VFKHLSIQTSLKILLILTSPKVSRHLDFGYCATSLFYTEKEAQNSAGCNLRINNSDVKQTVVAVGKEKRQTGSMLATI